MFSNLLRALRGESVPEPALTPPDFRGPTLQDADPPEMLAAPAVAGEDPADFGDLTRRAFVIVYGDAAGHQSERRVVCLRVYRAEDLAYLQARCLERQATRTFRVDRIREVYCGVTGEDLGRPDLLFVPTEHRQSRPRPDQKTVGMQRSLNVLMTMARADGRVHAGEQQAVDRFIDRVATVGMTPGDRLSLRDFALRRAPSLQEVASDFDAVIRWNRELVPDLMQTAIEVAEADGEFGQEEIEVVALLAERARAAGIRINFEV